MGFTMCLWYYLRWYSHQHALTTLGPSPLNRMLVIINVERCHFCCARSPPLSVSMSHCCSLLLILSWSYGGRDENGCLIMQRGQPIKGPGAEWFRGLFRAQLEGERKGGWPEKGVGAWGLIAVWCAGHLLSTYHWSGSTNNCPCLVDVQADWWMHGVARGRLARQMCA